MLELTRPRHEQFCLRHAIEIDCRIGISRGYYDWQSTFNRVEIIQELIESGWRGWVLYLDADAVINQPQFDIRRYIGKRQGAGLVAAAASDCPAGSWDINAGVFFLNLDSDRGRRLAEKWHQSVRMVVTDEMLRGTAEPWGRLSDGAPFPDDQHLLQTVLKDDPAIAETLLIADDGLINYGGGRFIRQFMRHGGGVDSRLSSIREVLGRHSNAMPLDLEKGLA